MVLHHFAHVLDRFVVVAQAGHDFLGHVGANALVLVETDAAGFIGLRGRLLADVVEKNAERELEVRLLNLRQHQPRMLENIALGMVLRRLLDAVQRGDVGQHLREQPALVEQVESLLRLGHGEDAVQLVADALGAHGADHFRAGANRLPRLRLDLEIEPRREPDRAQQPQMVLGKAVLRVANGAQDSRAQVGLAADKIDQAPGHRIDKTSR